MDSLKVLNQLRKLNYSLDAIEKAPADEARAQELAKADAEGRKILVSYQEGNVLSPMHDAVIHSYLSFMRWLERNGAAVDAISIGKGNYGLRPLYFACRDRTLATVRALLKMPGVDVNAPTINGETVLHQACRSLNETHSKKDAQIVLMLLAAGSEAKPTVAAEDLQNAFCVSTADPSSYPFASIPHPVRLAIYRNLDPDSLFFGFGQAWKGARAQVIADLIKRLF